MIDDKDQLAVMAQFDKLNENTHTYEETKGRVRIVVDNNKIPGDYFDIVEDMGYEVQEVNAYSNKEHKDAGYVKDYVSSMEIVVKPQ